MLSIHLVSPDSYYRSAAPLSVVRVSWQHRPLIEETGALYAYSLRVELIFQNGKDMEVCRPPLELYLMTLSELDVKASLHFYGIEHVTTTWAC